MRFQCPNCMSVVAIEDSEMGQPVACGGCHKVVVVPNSRTAPGSIIGDFLVEGEVGQGGLGTVYLTHQLSLDRPAALKILHERYAEDPVFVTDFVREARAAAQLNHPNIVQAYAVGEDEGIHFFAMEYAKGSTLKQVLAHSGRLVTEQALRIIHQIAQALNFAWENKQLVHRDIKPDNIILTDDGTVKLADLGLARVQEDLLNDESTEILGTPQYVAPEQLLGKPADNRSDIYSLGATLYHTVTGQYPYKGKSPAEIARKHITDPIASAKNVVPDIKDEVSALIWVMMAKRPGHRYQSVAELLEDMNLVIQGKPITRKALKSFQEPIDLGRVDEELSAELPESAAESSSKKPGSMLTAAQRAGLRGGASRTGKAGRFLKGRKARSEEEDADKKTTASDTGKGKLSLGKNKKTVTQIGRKPLRSKSTREETENEAEEAIQSQQQTAETAAAAAEKVGLPTGDQPEAGAEKPEGGARPTLKVKGTIRGTGRRRSPTGEVRGGGGSGAKKVLFGVLGVAALLLIGTALAVYLLAGRGGEVDADGLTPEERALVTKLERSVERDNPSEVLSALQEQIEKSKDKQPNLAEKLKTMVGPLLEKQAREVRRQRRETELSRWKERSAELIEEQREQKARLAEEARQAAEQARRQEEEERQRILREQRLDRLKEQQETLRREAIELCRNDEFYDARIRFSIMTASPEPEFKQWAESKVETIKQAERALNLVKDTGDLLKDARVIIPGRVRPGYVTSVDSRMIYAEIRDYGSGPDGQVVITDRVPVSVAINRLPTQKLLDLMGVSWRLQDGRDSELNLMLGAYLLARGENLDLAQQKLTATNRTDLSGPMLDELAKVREVVQQIDPSR